MTPPTTPCVLRERLQRPNKINKFNGIFVTVDFCRGGGGGGQQWVLHAEYAPLWSLRLFLIT